MGDTRLELLNKIAENRLDVKEEGGSLRDTLTEQGAIAQEVTEEEIEAAAAVPAPEVEEEETQEVETVETAPVYEKEGVWVAKIRVNGEDREVPFDQLKNSAQKDAASEARFAAAARKEQEARQLFEDAQAQAMQQEEEIVQEQDEGDAEALQGMAKELVEALNYGEEEAAIEKMVAVLQKTRGGSQVSAGEVERIVEERLAEKLEQQDTVRLQARIEAAQARWDIDYEDIGSDEILRDVATAKAQRLFSEDPSRDPYEVMAQAGNYVREKMGKGSATPVLPTSDEMAARAEKKRNLDQVSASSARATASGDDGMPPPASQIIDELRQMRGQRH